MTEAAIVARGLEPLRERLDALGVDSERLLRSRGVDPALLEREDVRIPVAVCDQIWTAAAEAAADPDFALHLAESIEPRSFGVLTYILEISATLGEALRRLAHHYEVISSAARYRIEREGPRARLLVELPGVERRARQAVEFLVATAYCFSRGQCVEPWTASVVWFPHPAPAKLDEHRRIFSGAPLEFAAPRCGFEFERRALDIALRRSDPRLLEILERHARELRRQASEDALLDQLRVVLSAALAEGAALSTDAAAGVLGTSARTLRRRLAEAGTSFSEVLDGLRREMAVNLLDSGRPAADVAHALGFSEPRTFSRAFRRWFQVTPAAYRKARAKG